MIYVRKPELRPVWLNDRKIMMPHELIVYKYNGKLVKHTIFMWELVIQSDFSKALFTP